MKRSFTKSVKLYASAFVLAFMVLSMGSKVNAQINPADIMSTTSAAVSKKAVSNLLENIGSENAGVRKSSIYYAGYYRVKEAAGPLSDLLKTEKDPSTRILISLSLYKMEDESAMEAVKYFAENDSNPKVKRMCKAIYNEYVSAHKRLAGK